MFAHTLKTFILLGCFISTMCFAESRLTCSSPDGTVTITTTKGNGTDFGNDTDLAEINIAEKGSFFVYVHPLTLKNNLFFVNPLDFGVSRDFFRLRLGTINSSNQYQRAKLVINPPSYLNSEYRRITPAPIKSELNCNVSSEYNLTNVCNETNKNKRSQNLLDAASVGDIDGVEQALACGADVDSVNTRGCNALMLSLTVSEKDCFATDTESQEIEPLRWAKGRYIFKNLLDEGASTTLKDNLGESIVHKVVKQGFVDLIQVLKSFDTDLNQQDKQGMTALMKAVVGHYLKGIEAMVNADVDLSVKNNAGKTAYDLGTNLSSSMRNTLLPSSSQGIVIQGLSNGCTPLSIKIPMGKTVKLTLKSTASEMFLMTSEDLSINLMSGPGGSASQIIKTDQMGSFKFQCGVHGGEQVTGTITITM